MNCCRQLIFVVCVVCPVILQAQSANPFDLSFRTSDTVAAVPATGISASPGEAAAVPEEVTVAVPEPVLDPPVTVADITLDTVVRGAESTTDPRQNPFDLVTTTNPLPRPKTRIQPETRPPAKEEEHQSDPIESSAQPDDIELDTTSTEASEIPVSGTTSTRADKRVVSPLLLLLLFGLILLLLTWVVNLNRGLLSKVYRATFNENLSGLLQREQRFSSDQYLYYLVYLVFFVSLGIFLYFAILDDFWTIRFTRVTLLYSIGFVLFVYLTRHLTLDVLARVFPVKKEIKHFNFNILLYNILCGIALIPIDLFLAFGPESFHRPMIIIGLIVIGLLYLARQFRGLVIASHLIAANMFHFFVYLCTIEILPVLVLIKFFHN